MKDYTTHRRKYKHLRSINLAFDISSAGLTALGSVLVHFTSLFSLTIAGVGFVMQGDLTKRNIQQKVETCKFAYTSQQKILSQIKSFLRGVKYKKTVFLSDVRIIDDGYVYSLKDQDSTTRMYSIIANIILLWSLATMHLYPLLYYNYILYLDGSLEIIWKLSTYINWLYALQVSWPVPHSIQLYNQES